MEDSAHSIRILVVNGDELWARSLDTILAPQGYVMDRAPTVKQALEQIGAARPDLVIIHNELRDGSGLELCRGLRQSGQIDASIPILVTTSGPCTREIRLNALRAGAWECYSLPLDAETVLLKLAVYASAKLDADRVREAALVDPGTGLYSPAGILRQIRELGLAAKRHQRALAVAVFALSAERFEQGVSAERWEEEVVRPILGVLTSVARTSDIIGRMSPTEFAVLAPETDRTGVAELARRLVNAMEEQAQAENALSVRVGCYAVADFSRAGIEPVEMLVRATLALRSTQATDADDRIRFFPEVPPSDDAESPIPSAAG